MKRVPLLFFGFWFLVGLASFGCSSADTQATSQPSETPLQTTEAAAPSDTPPPEETDAVAQLVASLATPTRDVNTNCLDCHSDAERLKALAEEPEATVNLSEGSVPPLEVWEKVLVNADALTNDVHSYIPCINCHGGQDVDDKQAAHEGLVVDPSIDAQAACGECHTNIAPYQQFSLHNNLAGYDTKLYARSVPENHPIIEEAEANHCNSCHTTCGQCHISQPTSVGGGLVDGHLFEKTPSMSQQCTACHGSRVKNEYAGAHEGYPADVHLRSGRMVCTDCHTAGDMHGTDYINTEAGPPEHRYDGAQSPSCESCHPDQAGVGSGNPYHEAHGTEVLSCQVCHSVSYANCYDCHLEKAEDGTPYYILDTEELNFLIGRNTLRSADRPYRFVPVRHVPTFPGLFDTYGENVLSNFDALPTWTYATPHNIQRNTPQNSSCDNCHGNDQYFLTPDKVRPEELAANESVIVPFAPPVREVYEYKLGQEGITVTAPTDVTPTVDPLDAPPSTVDPLDAPPG